MVRTTLGAEVETTVTVSGSESVDYLNEDRTSNVPAGNQQVTIVRSPVGSIYELLAFRFQARDVGAATTGTHALVVQSETATMNLLFAESDQSASVSYGRGTIQNANSRLGPPDPVTQVEIMRGLRFDRENGLFIAYKNDLDATQTETRRIRLWVREIEVG